MDAKRIIGAMSRLASGVHLLVAGHGNSPSPQSLLQSSAKDIPKRQSPIAKPKRVRRKNVPGCFAQHKRHRAQRAIQWQGRGLAQFVAIRTSRGLKFASRRWYLELVGRVRAKRAAASAAAMTDGKLQMAKGAA